ncbi:MAG: HD domain-containing protein [Candidatus Pacebacteria bacterium]|nr:HD domain-containing protein [Candidatus Paceibacterota bacterium]
MRNILEIYEHYKIMPNLALHQLRVASVIALICKNLEIKVDEDIAIQSGLLHDMGNIIKFDLTYFPEFNEPLGLAYWQNIQKEYFEKYGTDEHEATQKILKELGINDRVIEIDSKMIFGNLCIDKEGNDWELKLLHYADMRVGPFGVLSYEDRMEDARKRYANAPEDEMTREQNRRELLLACGKDIETQIFEHCKIRPEDINDESIAPILEELKGYMIK